MTALPTDRLLEDVWIWPEADGVRWWTPSHTEFLSLNSPCAVPGAATLRALRDDRTRLNLRYALAAPLGERLADLLSQGHRLCLHLSEALDTSWQQCPYEWMHANGNPVFGALLVERYAAKQATPLAPVHPGRRCVVLNLLASNEPIQPVDRLPAGIAQIIDGYPAASCFLEKTDIAELAALVVVSHGTESSTQQPFRLPDGRHWTLPTHRGLPPLVILLACGNDQGNLVWDSPRLLAAGAHTCLAPLGRPCPDAAGQLLAALLPAWQAGEPIGDSLLRLQSTADTAALRGAHLMQLVGRADLRMSAQPRLEEFDDQSLAVACRDQQPAALRVLIDRLTLRCFQTETPLEDAEKTLRGLLNVRALNEPAERWLFTQLQHQSDHCWLLSQTWVKALEADFAEAYDHSQIPRLEQARRRLEQARIRMPAPVYHYWSKLAYRHGRYALSLQDVAQALTQLEPESRCTRAAGLIGHLINLLVDVNLPDPAAVLQQQLEDCLAQRVDQEAQDEQHKLRDRAARIALRQGKPHRAETLYQIKREESRRQQRNGKRELAWLLYLGAWQDPEAARPLATEVHDLLVGANLLQQGFGPGNDDWIYLLRAYAAWAWRAGSQDAVDVLHGFEALLSKQLVSRDPGPPAFIIAFLQLCRRDGLELPDTLPHWDSLAVALEKERYFLELAAFSALMGRPSEAADMLERVQKQRTTETPLCFPDWLGDGSLQDWSQLITDRACFERSVLTPDQAVTPEQLMASGMLPL
ncbi:MAG: hypothetical protein VBE63_17160 [Lamprobacter sp.]|uniref:hypothetical protein n=1 Tax=Lamprobacter sp. TaxID=3100796 RepID=UPI002B25E66C|nr:hypothetical protein [Lamprobacter sp.]MEA3641651.1 hypothetical protein [Lamprobacter sp.]